MKLLELFCGTKSVGKIFEESFEVTSVDILQKWDPTICSDILDFDYKQFPVGYFDVIWASPPCTTFSTAKFTNIGRNGLTYEKCMEDIEKYGLPPLNKTLEIIDYLQPKIWLIENPRDGKMRHYIDRPYTDTAYCRYGFNYRKRTRIWNNLDLKLLECNHKGQHTNTLSMRRGGFSKEQKYVIPPDLVKSIYDQVLEVFH